jgi:hypothetical protein
MKSRENEKPPASESTCSEDEGRREFLKKCGRYAAYTTPVVMALLCHDEKTAHASLVSV